MPIIKFCLSTILGMAALVVALKLLGLLLFVVALVAKLMWMLIIVGFLALAGWVIYRIITPGRPEQI